jgi:hypothetical protein
MDYEPTSLGIEHGDIQLPDGEWRPNPARSPKPPPTPDQLRELRQRINLDLQRAQGGNRYGLGALQDVLDDELMERLPANMDNLRTTYRGFIHRWGYLREHQISNLADPNEIVQHVFKNPRDAYELYTEATPEQQEQLQERFVQYVWGDLPTTSPNADIAKTVRSRLAPYMRDPKTARAMLGGRAGQAYRNMVMWAKHAPDLAQSLEKSPQWRQAFGESFQRYFLKRGLSPADATQRAMAYLMLQLPGAEGATARVAGQTSLPVAHAGRHGMTNMLAGRHGAMAVMGAAMG